MKRIFNSGTGEESTPPKPVRKYWDIKPPAARPPTKPVRGIETARPAPSFFETLPAAWPGLSRRTTRTPRAFLREKPTRSAGRSQRAIVGGLTVAAAGLILILAAHIGKEATPTNFTASASGGSTDLANPNG